MTNGVLPNPSNNLQVQTGTGMNVIINPGFAICNGCLKLEETQRAMAVQASNDTYDRIDTVVLRLNDNDSVRECDFYVLQGVPATSPVRPELTQTDSIWEIGLADLFISKNSTVISADKITDTRYETARCGIISAIAEFDTTTIYNQIQADLADFKKEEQADILAWFEDIKGQIGEDAAINLQNQIGTLSLLDTGAKTDLVSAINEVKKTADDANAKEVNVLDSKEEILANTDSGKAAGASGVKEMFAEVSDSLGGLSFGYDSASGKYGYWKKEADTEVFVPFKSGERELPYYLGSFGHESVECARDTMTVSNFKFDLTDVQTITFSVIGTTSGFYPFTAGVCDVVPTIIDELLCTTEISVANTAVTATIDTSSLKGEYYLCFYSNMGVSGNYYRTVSDILFA